MMPDTCCRILDMMTSLNLRRSLILFSLLGILAAPAVAQEIRVSAKFRSDSVKLGKPIEFNLSAHYPKTLNVLFPDSTFSYAPFELQKKTYYTTRTKDGISVDSVTYILATYEVDSVQMLKLPIYVVNRMDCTQVFSNTDTVHFQHLVKAIPDSLTTDKLPLKVKLDYLGVKWQLNYILLGIVIGVLVIALIVAWIIFGKRIRKHFRLKKLMKAYELFRTQYENSLSSLEHEFSPQRAEQSLVIWKKYLETLLAKPYTKYTSKEIRLIENSEELGQSLSTIDRMIYGHQHDNVISPFSNLKEYVQQQFEKKKAEVANG
ncbi:hypothetical protein WSM22_33710 [Cytophagales bacterium WSM2-2]|nr:hypothetical protein WSM22_33710 [Cytophagales bacterium WSM2-2]